MSGVVSLSSAMLFVGVLAQPPSAAAAPAEGPSAPAQGAAAPADSVGRLSGGGTDNGALELGLGAAALTIGVGLTVAGSFDLASGLARKRQCANSFDDVCTIDGPGLIFASTGLAYAFAVPAFVGGALLLRRGARVHRDYKAVRALQRVQPSAWFRTGRTRGGGVQLRLRF